MLGISNLFIGGVWSFSGTTHCVSSDKSVKHNIFSLQLNFKKNRNNIEKSNVAEKPRCLTVGEKKILWRHLVDVYKFDQTETLIHIQKKLKEEHFQLNAALRMRNHLAEDVLDKRMHFLMRVVDS